MAPKTLPSHCCYLCQYLVGGLVDLKETKASIVGCRDANAGIIDSIPCHVYLPYIIVQGKDARDGTPVVMASAMAEEALECDRNCD